MYYAGNKSCKLSEKPKSKTIKSKMSGLVHIKEYPSIAEQLDYIYHNGLTKWKSDMIKPVKDKYPKE